MRLPQRSYRLIAPVFVGLQALVLVSCEPTSTLDPLSADGLTASEQRGGKHRAFSIALSAPDSSLTPGQQVQATAVVKDARGGVIANPRVTWTVAERDIAAVSATGLVTADTSTGSTTISATADNVTRTMTVSVTRDDVPETPAEPSGEGLDVVLAGFGDEHAGRCIRAHDLDHGERHDAQDR